MFVWHDARDDVEVCSTWSTAWQLETSHVNHMLYQFCYIGGKLSNKLNLDLQPELTKHISQGKSGIVVLKLYLETYHKVFNYLRTYKFTLNILFV